MQTCHNNDNNEENLGTFLKKTHLIFMRKYKDLTSLDSEIVPTD